MNRRIYIPFLLLIVALIATGCTEKSTVQEIEDPQLEIFNQYSDMFKTNPKIKEIEAFLNENLENCDSKYRDPMLIAFEKYEKLKLPENQDKLSVNLIDYTELTQYDEYASDELKSYFLILESEYLEQDLNSEDLSGVIDRLLDKSVNVENHLLLHRGSFTEDKMYELYVRYLYASIMNNGNYLEYAENDSTKIDEEILNHYQNFIDNHPDSHTASLLERYIDLLEQNDYDLESEHVKGFYFNFYTELRSFLWENKAP